MWTIVRWQVIKWNTRVTCQLWRCCPVRKRTSWTRGWWQSMGTVTLATITEAIWMVTRLTPRLGWVSPSASSTSYKKSFVIIESVMTIRDILMTYCLFPLIVHVHVQYHWDWNWTIFILQVWLTAEHEYVKKFSWRHVRTSAILRPNSNLKIQKVPTEFHRNSNTEMFSD